MGDLEPGRERERLDDIALAHADARRHGDVPSIGVARDRGQQGRPEPASSPLRGDPEDDQLVIRVGVGAGSADDEGDRNEQIIDDGTEQARAGLRRTGQ